MAGIAEYMYIDSSGRPTGWAPTLIIIRIHREVLVRQAYEAYAGHGR